MDALVIVVLYFVVLIGIGIFASKRTKNAQDFAVAGRRLSMFVALCTIIASEWGGGNVMGVSADAYAYGVSAYIYPLSMGIGIFLLGLLLAKKYWSIEEISMCKYIRKRYSKRCEILATVLMLLSIMLVTGSQFKSGGFLAETVFGLPHAQAVVIFAIIVCIYTSLGGLLAVAYNDTLNLILGGVGLIVCLIFGLNQVGGVTELIRAIPESHTDPRPYGSWIWAVDYLASCTFVMLAVPELIQRIWACKTPETARKACMAGSVVYVAYGVISLTLGLIALLLLPGIDAGMAIPALVMELFPRLIAMFIILSILAALVSTADTMLLICSAMIVEDLIKPFAKREFDDKESLRLMRVFVFVVGLVTVLFATGFDRVLGLILFSYYVYIGISTSFIFGRIWRGATERAAFFSMIISGLCSAVWEFGGLSYKVSWATTGIVSVVTAVLPFFLISLLDKSDRNRQSDRASQPLSVKEEV
ncbi:MAG: sodium:solute symporter family protein [Clostridiales Family XIII bacterium]|nr:sodium:solute symporter family protein [Clostridiales Family XIII bacterium]